MNARSSVADRCASMFPMPACTGPSASWHRGSDHQFWYRSKTTAHMTISPMSTKAVLRLPSRTWKNAAHVMMMANH